MIICSRCNTENEDGVKFCRECGNSLLTNVDALANEDLESSTDTSNEKMVHAEKQPFDLKKIITNITKKISKGIKKAGDFIVGLFRKIGKKRLIIVSSALVVVIASVILIVNYIVPYAPHYLKANKAIESKDYVTAISEYESADKFLNSNQKLIEAHYAYAEELFLTEKYVEASEHYKVSIQHEDSSEKLLQCASNLLDDKKYKEALDIYEFINTDEINEEKNYANGMVNFNKSQYDDAKKLFKNAGEYGDSKAMINACDFMLAEQSCDEGNFDAAKQIYTNLPQDFVYGEISVAGRLNLLNNSQSIINAVGTWKASDNYIESRNVYKRTGSWESAYYGHDNVLSGQTLEISCTINSNNTFDIEGEVSFYKFDDYSSLAAYCKAEKTSKNFTMCNVTTIPSSYQIDSHTTLSYSGGVFSIKYSERDDYSAHFYNLYSSSVTYGNR